MALKPKRKSNWLEFHSLDFHQRMLDYISTRYTSTALRRREISRWHIQCPYLSLSPSTPPVLLLSQVTGPVTMLSQVVRYDSSPLLFYSIHRHPVNANE